MKINKDQHSLRELEVARDLMTNLRQIAIENSPLINELESPEGYNLQFRSNEGKSFFHVGSFRFHGDGKVYFDFAYAPVSETKNGQTSAFAQAETIVSMFKTWISILRRKSEIDFDPVTTKYEKEIYADFRILDEDADTAPFTDNQQVVMLDYLSAVKAYLDSKDKEYNTKPIIEQIDRLTKEISSSPKNNVMRKLSAIWARIKKLSLLLFNDVMTVFRRDVIERAFNGYDYLKDNVEKILDVLRQLPP